MKADTPVGQVSAGQLHAAKKTKVYAAGLTPSRLRVAMMMVR